MDADDTVENTDLDREIEKPELGTSIPAEGAWPSSRRVTVLDAPKQFKLAAASAREIDRAGIIGSIHTVTTQRIPTFRMPSVAPLAVALAVGVLGQQHTSASEASSSGFSPGSTVLVVAAETLELERTRVVGGSVLIAHDMATRDNPGFVAVQSLEGSSLDVPRLKLIGLQTPSQPAVASPRSDTGRDDALPPLIRRQPQIVRDAWRQIAAAVDENEALPRPRPEPLFARAEVWMMVGNYDAALRDLLLAMRIADEADVTPRIYDAIFGRLREALERYDVTPVPPEDGEPSGHYGQGMHLFWAGCHEEAEKAFTNAISLAPGNPLYWYMRAVTRRRMGDEDAAKHDVLLGTAAERRACSEREYVSADINRELRRLQGSDRIWLEDRRRGDPARRTMSGMSR